MAFSMGMKLSERVTREMLARAGSAIGGGQSIPTGEPAMANPAITAIDQKVVDALMEAVDARVREHAAQVESRISEMQARIAVELMSLERQHQALVSAAQSGMDGAESRFAHVEAESAGVRSHVDEQLSVLREQIVSMHKEFAEAVAGIVRDQVASQVNARVADLERSLQEQAVILAEAVVEERMIGSAPLTGELLDVPPPVTSEPLLASLDNGTAVHAENHAASKRAKPKAPRKRKPASTEAAPE